MLAMAYDYLASTPPFNKWNLPDHEDVAFTVVKDRTLNGFYQFREHGHLIAVSSNAVGHTLSLMQGMAHEMIHMNQKIHGMDWTRHCTAFRKWAAQVCRFHGFDLKAFC